MSIVLEHTESSSMTVTQCGGILILTAPTGAGHDSVAVALQDAARESAPEVTVQRLNPLSGGNGGGPLSLGRWYAATTAHAPWLWRWLYRATNREPIIRLGTAVAARLWGRRLRTAVQTGQIGMIVAVHPLCVRLAGAVLRSMHDAPPLHCVVTDLVTIHRCWACNEVDAFYVATPDARDALIAMGIPYERVQVTGLPLRASFSTAPHSPADDPVPRVLLLGGGHPSRHLEYVARALLASRQPLHLVVVCGRNTLLQRRLTHALDARATVLGWSDDIAALLRWSSVVVTKGGPTTVAEALSQARPVLIYETLEDQETGNVALVERTGIGSYIPDAETLARSIVEPQASLPGGTAQAVWWGGAARRVGARVLKALEAQLVARTGAFDVLPNHAEDLEAPGRVICNPISGERIIIRQSGAETGGQLLSFDLFLPPGGHVPARHVHPNQEERFTVIEGQMRFRLGWRKIILAKPGDTVTVPPGTAHWFGNVGDRESLAHVEVRPALRLQEVFERSAAMEVMERIPGARMPRLSDLALFLLEFQRELAIPDVPGFLVRIFLAPFAWRGRRRRRQARTGWMQ